MFIAAAKIAFIFTEYSIFVPSPGQTNAFTVILNVILQIDIYQHFKYDTSSVLKEEMFKEKVHILSWTSKYTSKAYVEVYVEVSRGSLHDATLQADLIILYLSWGWGSSLNIRS